jgi:hypothetical protein
MTTPHGSTDYLIIPFSLLIISIVWLFKRKWLKEFELSNDLRDKNKVVWVDSFKKLWH